MQENKIENNNLKNMITKIINHKHTKSLAALAIVIGLIGYASEYKKSEAFDYSDYMYNVRIESNNSDDKIVAVAGNQVILSFEVYDAQVLSNLTATIYGKPASIECNLLTSEVLTNFGIIETAYAQFYNPAKCVAVIDMTQEDINSASSIINILPFEIKFTQITSGNDDMLTTSDFAATNTDDNSYVIIKRAGKASDYTSGVHIESTTPTDNTLASADNQVILTYYIKNDFSQVSGQKASIMGKDAKIDCVPDKEGIPLDIITSELATDTAQSSVKSTTSPVIIFNPAPVDIPVVPVKQEEQQTEQLKQLDILEAQTKRLQEATQEIIESMPSTFLESLSATAYAKEDLSKKEEKGNEKFNGPAKCTAYIDTSATELDVATYTIVPFFVGMTITTRVDKTEIKIENTTDKSFVRIQKAVAATPESVITSSILAIGLVSHTISTVIPQGQDVNPLIKNNKQDVAENLDTNGKCIPIKGFYKIGDKNQEIKEIRKSINKRMGTNLPINDKFDKELFTALKDWQEKYRDIVLDPWEMEGPSGYFYKTSNWSMNYQNGCSVPKFVLEKYKNNQN